MLEIRHPSRTMQLPLQTGNKDLTNNVLEIKPMLKLCLIDLSVDNFRHYIN